MNFAIFEVIVHNFGISDDDMTTEEIYLICKQEQKKKMRKCEENDN